MNKSELITLLRDPSKLSDSQLTELESIVDSYPYFLSARLLLAKASKVQGHPQTKKRVASAAIYSTDRILLKKYLSGNLFFLSSPPKIREDRKKLSSKKESTPIAETKTAKVAPAGAQRPPAKNLVSPPNAGNKPQQSAKPKPGDKKPTSVVIPEVPSGHLDSILEELKRDMENLKNSREKFIRVQNEIQDSDSSSGSTDEQEKKLVTEEVAVKTEIEDLEVEITEKELVVDTPLDENEGEIALNQIASEAPNTPEQSHEEVPESPPSKDPDLSALAQEAARSIREEFEKEEKSLSDEQKEDENPKQQESAQDKSKQEPDITQVIAKKEDENSNEYIRAEKVIREPRFSRFSSRSYLSAEQEIDPNHFLKEEVSVKSAAEEEVVEKPDSKSELENTNQSHEDGKTDTADKTSKPTKKKTPTRSKKIKNVAEGSKKEKPEAEKKTKNKKDDSAASEVKKKVAETPKEQSLSRNAQERIIEKFIQEAPTIKYQRGEIPKTEDLSTTSGAWDPNLASEYLAEIYLHQGNKKRATEIYEALILKYPEKKSYFADLISKID